MEFTIRNKNKGLPASLESEDIEVSYFAILMGAFFPNFIICAVLGAFLLNDSNVVVQILYILGATLWMMLSPFILIYLFRHKIYLKIYGDKTMGERLQSRLNNVYIDKNDNEKVYLLHELIKKHGINYSKNDQSDNNFLRLDINVDSSQYKEINYDNYDDNQIDAIKKVIAYKEIDSINTCYFFDQYIGEYIEPKIMTIEESNKVTQRIIDKNL